MATGADARWRMRAPDKRKILSPPDRLFPIDIAELRTEQSHVSVPIGRIAKFATSACSRMQRCLEHRRSRFTVAGKLFVPFTRARSRGDTD